jgi:hypothetical protein
MSRGQGVRGYCAIYGRRRKKSPELSYARRVGSFFSRLFGGGRAAVVCYLRENGPIAYELELFGADARPRVETMIDSGITWLWKAGAGAAREWTELSRISLSAFLSDAAAEGRSLLLVGLDGEAPFDVDDARIGEWLHAFARLQPSPVAALITSRGTLDRLFVQQHATDVVNQLLDAWGIDKREASRRAYARLGPDSLEAVAKTLG